MRDLFRRAALLFWQYPVLWVPLLIADAASYSANRLNRHISHQLVLWVYSTHSVLGSGADFMASPKMVREVSLLAGPVTWGGYFLSIFLYTAAMLITTAALNRIEQGDPANLPNSTIAILSRPRIIARFSFKVLVLHLAAAL